MLGIRPGRSGVFLLSWSAAAVLLTGCAIGDDPAADLPEAWFDASGVPLIEYAPQASRASATAPAQFRERIPLPDCGSAFTTNGPDSDAQWETAVALSETCLGDGLADGTGAELAVAVTTVEGQPVVQHIRVTPEGRMEHYVDWTWDDFGPDGWAYTECAAPNAPSLLDLCPDEPLPIG